MGLWGTYISGLLFHYRAGWVPGRLGEVLDWEVSTIDAFVNCLGCSMEECFFGKDIEGARVNSP